MIVVFGLGDTLVKRIEVIEFFEIARNIKEDLESVEPVGFVGLFFLGITIAG